MVDDNTRDIAVEALSTVKNHLQDCAQFRQNLRDDLRTNFAEFRTEFKRINWRMAFIIGGITLAGHLFDTILPSLSSFIK